MSITLNPFTGQFDVIGTSGGGGGVTNVTASSPLASSAGATPNITIQIANTSQDGYLSSTDWNTFNNGSANAANNTLSNLITTSINQDLLPASSSSLNIGSVDLHWNNIVSDSTNTNTISLQNGTTTQSIFDSSSNRMVPTGEMVQSIWYAPNIASNLGIVSGNPDSSNSGSLYIESADASGTGDLNSGDVKLAIGAALGAGTRGKIKFVDGSEGTAGQVWISTDTEGSGAWGPIISPVTTVFANGNIDPNFDIYIVVTTSNTITLTLPDPGTLNAGKTITFINQNGTWDGSFGFTLNRNATDSIYYGKADGSGLQQVTSILPKKIAAFTIMTDSSDWYIIGVMPF